MNPIDRMAVPTTILRGGMSPSVESSAGNRIVVELQNDDLGRLLTQGSDQQRSTECCAAAAEPAIVTAACDGDWN